MWRLGVDRERGGKQRRSKGGCRPSCDVHHVGLWQCATGVRSAHTSAKLKQRPAISQSVLPAHAEVGKQCRPGKAHVLEEQANRLLTRTAASACSRPRG